MRGAKEIDLNLLKELILVLDSYRVHRYVEIDFIDAAVKEGKLRKFVAEWQSVRPILVKMASSAASIPGVVKLVKIRDTISLASMVFLTVSFSLIIARILLRYSPVLAFGTLEELLYPSTLVLVFSALILRVVINREIGLRVETYYAENSEKFSTYQLKLKKLVQSLINVLSESVKRLHEEPENYVMKLYNCDYKKIKVIEKPSRFKKYYTVIPEGR